MKRIILILFAFLSLSCSSVLAQSKNISESRMGQEDRKADLGGKCGVLLLSKCSDLVISVINASEAKITPRGKGGSGLFEYEVIIDRNDTPNPNLEISRRGDVNRRKFVAKIRPDYLTAYLIEELERPIIMENQTTSTDVILDETLAEVEITSALTDLSVDCHPSLGATVTRSKKKSDESINIISVKIPIANINNAKKKVSDLRDSYKALYDKVYAQTGKQNDKDFDTLDNLEEELQDAEQTLAAMYVISVYGKETNRLEITVEGMGPRCKQCYGILLMKTVVREHVSKCSGMLEEGSRLFSARKYDEAKRAFSNALTAGDTPQDLIPAINSNIAQCDSCILYENLTKAALLKIKELKERNTVTQADVSQYYNAAIEFMKITEKYNPCEYYTNIINTLETYVENMPLAMKFTVVKWVVDRISAYEAGPFPGIDVWAYYGSATPRQTEYSSDRKFRNLTSKNAAQYKRIGVTGTDGVIDMELMRKSLPTGFFFRHIIDDRKTDIVYKDMAEVMQQSKGEYQKRQIRLKMYIKK